MSRAVDLGAPMRSLRDAAGLTIAEMARVRGVAPPTIHDSEAAGDGVRLATLAEAARLCGFRLALRLVDDTPVGT